MNKIEFYLKDSFETPFSKDHRSNKSQPNGTTLHITSNTLRYMKEDREILTVLKEMDLKSWKLQKLSLFSEELPAGSNQFFFHSHDYNERLNTIRSTVQSQDYLIMTIFLRQRTERGKSVKVFPSFFIYEFNTQKHFFLKSSLSLTDADYMEAVWGYFGPGFRLVLHKNEIFVFRCRRTGGLVEIYDYEHFDLKTRRKRFGCLKISSHLYQSMKEFVGMTTRLDDVSRSRDSQRSEVSENEWAQKILPQR